MNDHITAGMMALYTVLPGNGSIDEEIYAQLNGTIRHYYVAAEEVMRHAVWVMCRRAWCSTGVRLDS